MITIKCRDTIFTDIQAILFDKNGTLEDSQIFLRTLGQKTARIIDAQIPGIGEPLLMSFGINGDRLDPSGLLSVATRRETEVAAAAYIAETGRGWFASLKIACTALTQAQEYAEKQPAPLFPGTVELLKILSSQEVKLGILSAASTESVKNFIKIHNLTDYFHLGMGVDLGPGKPDPAFFIQACTALGVKPEHTLMVGDSVGDMQMARHARAAGCIGISWINYIDHVQGADVMINSLDELVLS